MSVAFDELGKVRENTEEMANFSDVEEYGKYLDLHECYDRYINLKGIEKVDYITYLNNFDRLATSRKDARWENSAITC